MISVDDDIININDIIIDSNNTNNTNIHNINKYIFDLFYTFQKCIHEELQIKFEFPLPNKQINTTNLFVKINYISYFNKYTSDDIKFKLKQIMKNNDNFINQLINSFEIQTSKKKQDCIFILFITKSHKSDSYIGYMPILIDDYDIKITIKLNDIEVFNTKNY